LPTHNLLFPTSSETKKTLTDSIHVNISKNILALFFKRRIFEGVSSAIDEITSNWKD